MEAALKTYLGKCQLIFNQHHLKMTRVATFPGTSTDPINDRRLFEEAIKEAEDTKEFEAFVNVLQAGPLSSEIERLTKKEERSREKTEKKRKMEFRDIDEWRKDTAHQAAEGFFRNTGAYVNLWQSLHIDAEKELKAHTITYVDDPELGTIAPDVWEDMPSYQPKPAVNTKYPTQKPDEILERVIGSGSKAGELVADFFAVPARLRRWQRSWAGSGLQPTSASSPFTLPGSG